MSELPSVNQVVLYGTPSKITLYPKQKFPCKFQLDIPENGYKAASLLCGIGGDGSDIRRAIIDDNWIFVIGTAMTGGFIKVREMFITSKPNNTSDGIHFIALTGEIVSVRAVQGNIYERQFDLKVYKEYGGQQYENVDGLLTCGLAGESYTEEFYSAQEGQWAAVQGKIKSNGFINVRSLSIFSVK